MPYQSVSSTKRIHTIRLCLPCRSRAQTALPRYRCVNFSLRYELSHSLSLSLSLFLSLSLTLCYSLARSLRVANVFIQTVRACECAYKHERMYEECRIHTLLYERTEPRTYSDWCINSNSRAAQQQQRYLYSRSFFYEDVIRCCFCCCCCRRRRHHHCIPRIPCNVATILCYDICCSPELFRGKRFYVFACVRARVRPCVCLHIVGNWLGCQCHVLYIIYIIAIHVWIFSFYLLFYQSMQCWNTMHDKIRAMV